MHLDVRCFRCTLGKGPDGPESSGPPASVIAPDGADAWLQVGLSFQHLGEQAFYGLKPGDTVRDPLIPGDETQANQILAKGPSAAPPLGTETPSSPPIHVRAANPSWLAFDVPEGERIPFTVAGVLTALSRLPLRVAPLATPRPQRRQDLIVIGLVAELPGKTSLVRTTGGLALMKSARAERLLGLEERARGRESTRTMEDLLAGSSQLRVARMALGTGGAVDLSGLGVEAARGGLEATGVRSLVDRVAAPQRIPRRAVPARPPRPDETAIEAPYRLIISPSNRGGFAHAQLPVEAGEHGDRVELWHTRLGVRDEINGVVVVDEGASEQRIVRAIWARDRAYHDDPDKLDAELLKPFRMSLDQRDRHMLVRQSAETQYAAPEPVDVHKLSLSALGAALDLHGAWEITAYAKAKKPSILSWDHVAPLGRDQFVQVVYPGYVFPFGHACALVKVTERKIDKDKDPQAYLYQRKFLVFGEPVRSYDQRDLPFKEVRILPLQTPTIRDPLAADTPHTAETSGGWFNLGIARDQLFWPVLLGETAKFRFTLDALDQAGRRVRFRAPLLFVAAHLGASLPGIEPPISIEQLYISSIYQQDPTVAGEGQPVAFAQPRVEGDTTLEVSQLRFAGDAADPGELNARPRLAEATVVVPTMRQLAQAQALKMTYAQVYLKHGFTPGKNKNEGQVFATFNSGKVVYENTERSGALVAPNFPVQGLSRKLGAVGEIDKVAAGAFSRDDFFAALDASEMPKLFGIVELKDLLASDDLGLDRAPRFITELLDVPRALLIDLPRLTDAVNEGIARLGAEAQAIKAQLQPIRNALQQRIDQVVAALDALEPVETPASLDDIEAQLKQPLGKIGELVGELEGIVPTAPLPPTIKADLERLVSALRPLLAAGDALDGTLAAIQAMVNGVAAGDLATRARYEWRPKLANWPKAKPIIEVPEDGFTLTVEARASAQDDAGVDVLTELRDLTLNLPPKPNRLIALAFERIAFRGTSGRKPEIDVRFTGIEFDGLLEFVETLQEIIPLDALSDPPYVDVDESEARAGIDLAVPNVAVGAFSLENINLGAEARVPFLGEAVTVGFNFCSKERPFVLTVMAFGGGGFIGLRAAPKGLVVLEGALEFGARLSLNFGVASGSIEAMGGIYYRLEETESTLSGYFRLRGEVEVLGIASASLTLELALTYKDGKMAGRARVTLEIEVGPFEKSVSFTVERKFAGANGDPTFAEMIEVAPDGGSEHWSAYCLAFATEPAS